MNVKYILYLIYVRAQQLTKILTSCSDRLGFQGCWTVTYILIINIFDWCSRLTYKKENIHQYSAKIVSPSHIKTNTSLKVHNI